MQGEYSNEKSGKVILNFRGCFAKRHTERGAIDESLIDPKAKLASEEFQERLQSIIAQQSRPIEKPI